MARQGFTSKELAPIHCVNSGTLQNACSTRPRVVADLVNSLVKGLKRMKKNEQHYRQGGVKNAYSQHMRQLGSVFQDMEPPKSPSILRKSRSEVSNSQKSSLVMLTFETEIFRSVTFAEVNLISAAPTTLQNLRIGLRRRQTGKTEVPAKQRGSWPKVDLKLKEHQRAAFFSSPENRCLPASTLKREEREFVADSGASMHMISKKRT